MKKYEAVDGTAFTDDDINEWCEYYDRGEFPPGEHSTGEIVHSRPPKKESEQVTLTVKLPIGMRKALKNYAKEKGISTSALVRNQLAKIWI